MKNSLKEFESIDWKYAVLTDCLTKKGKRLWVAAESLLYGRGGIILVSKAISIARSTEKGIRKTGVGKKISEKQEKLVKSLDELVESASRGDPESALRWTCKTTRNLEEELKNEGYQVGYRTIAHLLHELEYSLQSNRKTLEGGSHIYRNARFESINRGTRIYPLLFIAHFSKSRFERESFFRRILWLIKSRSDL